MCERKTGKLVTGPAAPTENTLLSWLLRHPSFEVVQPTHQAPQPSMQLYTSQFNISINNVHIVRARSVNISCVKQFLCLNIFE